MHIYIYIYIYIYICIILFLKCSITMAINSSLTKEHFAFLFLQKSKDFAEHIFLHFPELFVEFLLKMATSPGTIFSSHFPKFL